MTRRVSHMLSAVALFAFAGATGTAGAQRASLAVGVATPVGDLANSAGSGFDVQFQARTEPMLGPLPLRIDIGYEWLTGKGAARSTTVSAESLSLMGDFGTAFYWVAGPGYYQLTSTINIAGHNASAEQSFFGTQVAVGMDIPVFRWDGFLEVSGVRLYSPHAPMYVPLRFGIRL
jgi:hypothetical protein